MVEQVVAALSNFRQAARDANDNVRQLLSGIMPSASRANESSRELRDTARASSQSDNDTRSASNKAALIAEETASLGEQILNELKEFSKKFTTLISGEGDSFVDNIFGMGLGAMGIAGVSALSAPFEDLYSGNTGNEGYGNRPAEGFSGNLAKITTESGKSTWVAEEHAAKFQGFINDLQATGYKINDLGGYNYRANVNNPKYLSYHGLGAAIDINPAQNPNGTNKTDMPKETADLARKWGLGWGMSFQDPMHFSAAKLEGGSADIPRQEYFANSPFDINYKETGSVAGTDTNTPTNINQTETETEDSESIGQATSSSEPQVTAASTTPPELPKSETTKNLPLVETSASTNTELKTASGVESSIETPTEPIKSEKTNLNTEPAVDLTSPEIKYKAASGVESTIIDSSSSTNNTETDNLQPAKITQASFSNLETSRMSKTSLAMDNARVEKDNSKLEKPTLRSVPVVDSPSSVVDLTSPEINYKTASSVDSLITPSLPVSKSQYPKISPVSLAMDNARVETVNFEKTKLELASVDLTPATPSQSQPARLSGANISRPVVTPAASYIAPQESSVASVGLPNTKTPEPLDVNFDTNWIAVANGIKRETNKTWVA